MGVALVTLPTLAAACPLDPTRDAGVLLTISWPGQPPLRLRAADFSAMAPLDIVQRRSLAPAGAASGATLEQSLRYGGVLLRELLASAEPAESKGRGARALLFEAVASDGYRAIFSWGELFNSSTGEQVLVIHSQDGRPLTSEQGPLALRALADYRPGPRHVRNLCGISARGL